MFTKLYFELGEWCNETALIAIMYYLVNSSFNIVYFQTPDRLNLFIYFSTHVSDYLSHAQF